MNQKNGLCLLFLVLLLSPHNIMAAIEEMEVRHTRQVAIPPVFVGAVVSPYVFLALLAIYGAAVLISNGVQKASSDSHSCANNRGWCRLSCFSHEYVDWYNTAVCGYYKCCRPK
uniref:Big defensin n=1 Tax=Sinohyriopsis cumingii TaxID=165450 RepID=J9PGJ9_SINCU|nr:big defensin [Sinohyriopsis cumingii]